MRRTCEMPKTSEAFRGYLCKVMTDGRWAMSEANMENLQNMSKADLWAIYKSIWRNCPFFRSGGTFGFDLNTLHACGYERTARVMRYCLCVLARVEGGQK